MTRCILFLALLAFSALILQAKNKMNELNELLVDDINRFKSEIGAGAVKKANGFVVLDWPEQFRVSGCLAGWNIDKCTSSVYIGKYNGNPDRIGLRARFISSKGRVDLSIQWFEAGADAAQHAMFMNAVSTTMAAPPFEKGPEIGDLCLKSKSGSRCLLWCYANVFCELNLIQGSVDILALAEELQAGMEKALRSDLNAVKPVVESFTCSNRRPKIDEELVVSIVVKADDLSSCVFSEGYDRDFIMSQRTSELSDLRFKVVAAGKTTIRVGVARATTLVPTYIDIQIENLSATE